MTTATDPTPADNASGRYCAGTASIRPEAARTTPPTVTGRPAGSARDGACAPNEPAADRLSLRVDTPSECIAAVPALLGYVPRQSIVALLLNEAPPRSGAVILGAVTHHELVLSGPAAWARLSEQLAGLCARQRVVAVLVLIIDDRAAQPGGDRATRRRGRHRELVGALESALAAEGIQLDEAWGMCAIAPGAPWWDVLAPGTAGVQTDPAASPVALAEAFDERGTCSSHTEPSVPLELDAQLSHDVRGELEMATIEAGHRFRAAVFRDEVSRYQRSSLEEVLDRVDGVAAGGELGARAMARIAVALRDPTVRDAMFALAGGPRADAAEQVWAHLCRALTGRDRAEAATLLGYCAFTRGDRSLAGTALQAALESNSDHTLARLLDTALGVGMQPQEIRKLACSGRAKAAELGVELDLHPEWPQP
ncbi:hypothetical protein ABIA39_001956 [Nocardia sp. GAS34]|uniref:DUF4192 domain-containing protein n=1 Tax=unclassified Nocardia TaxID=2637762 RepID=UPI003D24B313